MARAVNEQLSIERGIQERLAPLLKELALLKRDNTVLQVQSDLNKQLEKQVSLQKQIRESIISQAEADLAFKVKEAGVRNPFFNQERASAKFRLEMEEKFAVYKEQQIKNEFDMKRQAIEMEYELLSMKSQVAAKEAEIAAQTARERAATNPEQAALADHYDKLSNLHLSFLPQYQAGKELAIQLADQLEKASLADLKRLRADLQLAIQEMEPMNMLLDDAAKAFGSSLNDAVNALFTSMHDKSMDLGEALKEIGRGLLQTIQEAVTKRLIVDPLLESLGLLDDPTAAMKQAIEEAADKLAEKSAKAITDTASTVESGGDKVATKVKGSFDQGATTAASKIREAIRDIELRIKVQCCEGGGTGSDVGGEVADAVSSAVGGATKGTDVAGYTTSVNADDPLVKQQLLSMKQSLLPQGQPEIMGYDFKTSVAEGVKQGILMSQAESVAQGKDPGSVGPMDSSLTDIAAPKLPPKPGTEAIANTEDAEETKAAATEENTGMLTRLGDVMGENVLQTGLAVSALLGNSKAGQALQKVMLALNAGQMVMKLWTALNTKSEVANTTAIVANTAAITASAAAGVVGGGRTGIYPPLGYATGGIARGPNAGYPAILHGTEAVVPLPNGKDIPVEMKGGGTSQQNNVTVNVTVDNQGQGTTESSQSDGERGGQLGAVISMAVQKELQNQKRPGGILSPYGVS